MPTLTETLIDKILAVKYDALPAAAIDMAKACTLDGIAVMLARHRATGPGAHRHAIREGQRR